jgi:hypothetical protein
MKGRWRPLLLVIALVVVVGPVAGRHSRARADDASSCASFQSIGAASPNGVEYGIPYEIFGGSPYVETEISSAPKARSLASSLYPGQIGEILLGTAGLGYKDPTTKEAFWPAVQGGKSTESTNLTAAQTFASTGQGPQALAWGTFGGGSPAQGFAFGPSYATSQTSFHDGVVSGQDETWSYNVQLGGVSFFSIHSLVGYRTDGTDRGTTGNWLLEFSGIHNGSSPVASLSGNGISLQGGSPQPGPGPAEQTGAAVSQLSTLLQTAGVGKLSVSLKPGAVQVSAGKVQVLGASLQVRFDPKPTAGQIGDSVAVLFGYENRSVTMNTGGCSNVSSGDTGADTGTGAAAPATSSSAGSSAGSASSAPVTPAAAPSVAAIGPANNVVRARPISQPARLATRALPLAGAAALWGRRAYDWLLVVLLVGVGALAGLGLFVRYTLSRL